MRVPVEKRERKTQSDLFSFCLNNTAKGAQDTSSEDNTTEYPEVEYIAFSSSKLTLYFATPVIKGHGTITPGRKGGVDRAESHYSSPTDSPACPTPSSLWLHLENTGGFAQKPGVSLLASKNTSFFSTQEVLKRHSH